MRSLGNDAVKRLTDLSLFHTRPHHKQRDA